MARYIQDKYKSNDLIGICIERGFNMFIAILAVLKLGKAYLPIEPNYPSERLLYILKDTNCNLILSESIFVKELKTTTKSLQSLSFICVDKKSFAVKGDNNLNKNYPSNELAYVIYTSGSTGKPKGVAIKHRSVINRIDWMQSEFQLTSNDVVLHKTPFVFDVSVWELFWAVLFGAKVAIAKPEEHKNNKYLFNIINEKNVTVMHFVPSMLTTFVDFIDGLPVRSFPSSLRYLFASGEYLPLHLVKRTYSVTEPHLQFYNLYGPTEATIDVSYINCQNFIDKSYIGKPIQNTQLYVLNDNLKPVPIGAVGELYIGGEGLAKNYFNNSTLTNEKFINNPYLTPELKACGYLKIYKTGDLVRYSNNGNIEYIGRIDRQIKLRGYRLELQEIDNVVVGYNKITSSVSVLSEQQKSKHIICYYVSSNKIDHDLLNNYFDTSNQQLILPEELAHLK